jgi:hypothetical protein
MPLHDRVCAVCEQVVEPGDRVSFQHGDLLHLDCYERTKTKPPTRADGREEPKRDEGSAGG